MANGQIGNQLALTPADQQRIRMAQAMQRQGRQAQNRTPLEAIGNTLMNIRGQQVQEDVAEQQADRRDAYARTMRNVATAGQQGVVTGPGGGGTGEVATPKQRMIDFLSANPDTAPTAAQLQMSQALQPEQPRTQTISGEQANQMFGTQLAPGSAVTIEAGPQGRRITNVQEPSRQDSTQTEREIQRYIERGYDRSTAEDIAYGNIDVETDQFGNTYLVNKATGDRRVLRGTGEEQRGGGSTQTDQQSPIQPQDQQEQNLFRAVDETGPWAWLRSAGNNVIGPFLEGVPFEQTAASKQQLRQFNYAVQQAFKQDDGRMSNYERQIIREFLPDPDRVFTDPDKERIKLREMRTFLQSQRGQLQGSMDEKVTAKERGKLSNQIETIDRVLNLMGSPEQQGQQFTMENPAQPTTQEEYEQLPSGAYFRDDEGLKRKP